MMQMTCEWGFMPLPEGKEGVMPTDVNLICTCSPARENRHRKELIMMVQ